MPWDFPPQSSRFPPQDLLPLLYFVLLSHPKWHQLPNIVISKAMVLYEMLMMYFFGTISNSKVYAEEQEKDHSKSKRRDRSNLAIRRDSTPLELPTERLLRWRRAVKDAMSASQLALCMCELERCIAWEKSSTIVVRAGSLSLSPSFYHALFSSTLCLSPPPLPLVSLPTLSLFWISLAIYICLSPQFCQACHSGENENLLLLCDGCDKGTHTYCCKVHVYTCTCMHVHVHVDEIINLAFLPSLVPPSPNYYSKMFRV